MNYLPIIRIGQGYDLHRLEAGRPLILGGVSIKSQQGLLGHSDADVLIHAVIDALLGAAALGDIGQWFPDTNENYRGIASTKLLPPVLDKIQELGFTIANVDITIVAEKPKLMPYKELIKKSLASHLRIAPDDVNIKAKTNEKLGPVGRGEAIACYSIVGLAGLAEKFAP